MKEPQIPIKKLGYLGTFIFFLTLVEYHAANNVYIATVFEHLVNIVILKQTNLFSLFSKIVVIINLT